MNYPSSTFLKIMRATILIVTIPSMAWGSNIAEPEFAKGWDLLQQNKYAEARTLLEAGMKNNQSNSLAHFYLGDACRGLKDWVCAEEHYTASLEVDPKSSVADVAKARLRKAKAWRLLGEARRVLEGNDPSRLSQAEEKLAILKALELDEEQAALHTLLAQKLKGQTAENLAATSASSEMGLRQRLNGLWKFRDGRGVYRITVQDSGEIRMTVERTVDGVRYNVNDTILQSFAIDKNRTELLNFHSLPVMKLFTRDAAFISTGYYKSVAEFAAWEEKSRRGEKARCPLEIKYRQIMSVLAYIPVLETIRLLPLQVVYREEPGCGIFVKDAQPGYSEASDIEELVRTN